MGHSKTLKWILYHTCLGIIMYRDYAPLQLFSADGARYQVGPDFTHRVIYLLYMIDTVSWNMEIIFRWLQWAPVCCFTFLPHYYAINIVTGYRDGGSRFLLGSHGGWRDLARGSRLAGCKPLTFTPGRLWMSVHSGKPGMISLNIHGSLPFWFPFKMSSC